MKVPKKDKCIGKDVRRVPENYCPRWTVFLFYIRLRRYQIYLKSVFSYLIIQQKKGKIPSYFSTIVLMPGNEVIGKDKGILISLKGIWIC